MSILGRKSPLRLPFHLENVINKSSALSPCTLLSKAYPKRDKERLSCIYYVSAPSTALQTLSIPGSLKNKVLRFTRTNAVLPSKHAELSLHRPVMSALQEPAYHPSQPHLWKGEGKAQVPQWGSRAHPNAPPLMTASRKPRGKEETSLGSSRSILKSESDWTGSNAGSVWLWTWESDFTFPNLSPTPK